MQTDDLENSLRNLKSIHLTGNELVAYLDQEPDPMLWTRVDTHLQQCFTCERQLALLREESAALCNPQITSEDSALIERLIKQIEVAQPSRAETDKGVSLQERLAEYLRQMVTSWRLQFAQVATRNAVNQGVEVWRWQSEDGKLQARAILEKNGALSIDLFSNDMELEGMRFNFRLGPLSQEIKLRRVSDQEVHSKVEIPRRHRPRNLKDISIEML